MPIPEPFEAGTDGDYPPGSDAWAETPIVVAPSAGKLAAGWVPQEQLAAQHFNWLCEQVGLLTQRETVIVAGQDSAIARVATGGFVNTIGIPEDDDIHGSRMLLVFLGTAGSIADDYTPPELVSSDLTNSASAGVPMIPIQGGSFTANGVRLACYYLPDIMMGSGVDLSTNRSYVVRINTPSPDQETLMFQLILSGVHQLKAPSALHNSSLTGPELDVEAGGMIIDMLWNDTHTEDPTCDASQTEIADGNGGGTDFRISLSYRQFTDADSYAPVWTGPVGTIRHMTLSFAPHPTHLL